MELTGNTFGSERFEKKPAKYQILDIKFDEQKEVLDNLVESKLDPSVYAMMKLICNEKTMKETMLKFSLDTDKIPLGRISKKQIRIASKILRELSALVESNGTNDQLIEASNRFYTMIPHSFGMKTIPVINSTDMIQNKMQMLERLKEIEFTYSLMNETDENQNLLDSLHEKMNAAIAPLCQDSDEYQQIVTYAQQTNDNDFGCECGCCGERTVLVKEIFKVDRHGEDERFVRFAKSNRMLLWHGSNLTNFTGILSNGLKIAPTDTALNGTCFGKGIYFADAIAKSAQYCGCDTGVALLLLCEVELGDILELHRPTQIKNLHSGKNSVKGIGNCHSPSMFTRSDGLQIPLGNIQMDSQMNSNLQFNEYIVYNEAQVKIRYLVKAEFGHEEIDDSDYDMSDAESCVSHTESIVSISSTDSNIYL